ncbi:MAG TPA: RNB domain-containing ribonuclease, partial [Pyrinomonadaceae bacterium]
VVTREDLNRMLLHFKGHPESLVVETAAIQSMAKAVYSPDNIGHFGLGFSWYSHFTSPIRRYPDLIAHRLLKRYAADGEQERRVGEDASLDVLRGQCKHLSAREREAAEAETRAAEAALQSEAARAEHDRALASYDRERHATERGALALARERAAATEAQLEAARERAEALSAEVARLDEVRESMREEFRARERLEELYAATDFIRDTLRKAGPLVTESYLYNISIEANQLFREITGEGGRALRWSKDYDILLEEEGHERSFINLSGGEQMVAALSVRLALLKQLSDIRVAFFDEPTVNMDAERRERLAQQIGQVRDFDQLFVISHDDTFEQSVDHVVAVTRETIGEAA